MQRKCINCKIILTERHKIKFCSNKCQNDGYHEAFIRKWKEDQVSGIIGISAKNISGHVRKYLFEKYKNKCSECGWHKLNNITGKIPLEVDHIDGNSENNKESNLRILCPNCHSLTPHFRNLNKGKGRQWRKKKYIKNSIS